MELHTLKDGRMVLIEEPGDDPEIIGKGTTVYLYAPEWKQLLATMMNDKSSIQESFKVESCRPDGAFAISNERMRIVLTTNPSHDSYEQVRDIRKSDRWKAFDIMLDVPACNVVLIPLADPIEEHTDETKETI